MVIHMNLVIDCFKLVKGAGKSIGIYNLAASLTRHLGLENVRQGEKENIIVLGNGHNRKDFQVPGVTFVEVRAGDPLDKLYCIYWELFAVTRYARRYKADRILFPRGYRPLVYRGKDTLIIHDLIPFYYDEHYPGVFNRVENAYIMRRLKSSIRGADRVVTISACSREDILKRVPGCGKKIKVIGNGINEMPPVKTPPVRDGKGGYIAAVTSTLPHKNAQGILTAYETYRRMAPEPLDLLVIGIEGTEAYRIDKEAAAHVTCRRYVESPEEMSRLIAGGKVFLFLSYMEGFGFPPLEAMQLDVPVVCSNRSSLPEVVGNAGILVDPDNAVLTAQALIRVTENEELGRKLVERGRENIRRYSWESRTKLYWKELFG